MNTKLAITVLGCWLSCSWCAPAFAQNVRVVLLAKELRDGQPQPQASLEAAAAAVLRTQGVRVVELDAALQAQSLALAASLDQGQVPRELTVLNADAALSLQLSCDQSASAVMGSKLLAYYCVLGSKLVRLDTGDVVFGESAELTGHGLNAAMAVQAVLKARVPELMQAQTERWLARLTGGERWAVDLVVTGLSDRATASALAVHLGDLPGIEVPRLVLWNRGTAKYALAGRGRSALDQLADAVDRHADLALTVTYQAERSLHAEYDFAKAYRRRVMVMSVAELADGDAELGPQLVGTALMNLPYLEMAHSRPLLSTPGSEQALAGRLRDKAADLDVPLLLVCRFSERNTRWTAGMQLVHVASGRTVAAATGEGDGVAEAIDRAVRAFDERYRTTLTRASTRTRLGLESGTVARVSASGLVIHSFRVPPQLAGTRSPTQQGVLELENASAETLRDVRVTIEAAGKRVLDRALPDFAPGAKQVLPVPIAAGLDAGDDGLIALGATLSYRQGERRGLASAFASWIAEPRGAPAALAATPGEYDQQMKDGLSHALHGRWELAQSAFARAHALHPDARTLRALGFVEFDLGHRDRAAQLLRDALAHQARPLTGEQRREVEAVLERLERFARAAPAARAKLTR